MLHNLKGITMERIEVKDIYQFVNQEIDTYLLVLKKELREGKKDHFIRVEFTDKSGPITGNVWNNALAVMDMFKEGEVAKIRATVINYKDQIQLNIKKIRTAEANEYEFADFIPQTKKDMSILSDEFFALIDSISDEHIKTLLTNIFEDKELWDKFYQCPAAKSWHHNYVGGLLEHTISVAKICDFASKLYPVKRNELIAGALLHDFGKIFEYTTLPSIEFTDEGRLLGHIAMGDYFLCQKAHEINLFPIKTLMKIRHLILSHHGEPEKGAVKIPQTLEAIVLHFADNMDAQTTGVNQLIEAVNDPNAQWTEYDRLNNRYIYIG
jgi:3'-5' exoribonuclease